MAPRQNRHILKELCPPWLRGTQAHSFLNEGIFTLYDIDAELMWQALMARFPSYCPADALPYLAADRRTFVSPSESEEALRVRLLAWMIEATLAGLPIGLLLAMQAFCAENYPKVRVVTKKSIWYTLEEGAVPRMLGLSGYERLPPCPYESGANWPIGTIASATERLRFSGLYTREKVSPANFDWDSLSNPERAACWWDSVGVIYGRYDKQKAWDSGLWVWDDPSQSLGIDHPYGNLITLRYVANQRKSCKSVLRAVVWTDNTTLFDPSKSLGDPELPDGYWGRPGRVVAGHLTPTRRNDCRVMTSFPRY
jgi:hypothetical protein